MSTRQDPGAAINSRTVLNRVFDPDPRGWALFSALSRTQQRGLSGREAGVYAPMPGYAGAAYHGSFPLRLQNFTGQAGLGLARPIGDGSRQLQRETSTLLTDGPMKIWAERMQRTAGSGTVTEAVRASAARSA